MVGTIRNRSTAFAFFTNPRGLTIPVFPRMAASMDHEQASRWIDRIIHDRHSIKPADFDPDRPVDRDQIKWLLGLAQRAPTHGLTQPWRFAVFTGRAREVLGRHLQDLYRDATPEPRQQLEKLAKLGTTPALSPVVIVIGVHWDETGRIPQIEEIAATACAVENLHLAATAIGLGGYWSSPPCLYHGSGPAHLGLADRMDHLLGLFYLGWPKPGLTRPASPRRPMDEQVSWHSEVG